MKAAVIAGLVVLGVVASAPSPGAQSASAPAGGAPDAEMQALRERAAAFWAARMAGDDKRQWELLEPRGQGRLTPREYAADRGGVQYLGYQVESATIHGFFAIVKVRLLVQPILPTLTRVPVQTALIDDQWVRVGGAWYRQLEERQTQGRGP